MRSITLSLNSLRCRQLCGTLLALVAALALPTVSAHGTTYYWDVNGTTPGFSTVVGAWNGTNAFWNTDMTGDVGGSTTAVTTAADDLIIAQATTNTGNITVTGTQNASSITFAPNVGPTATITGGTAIVIGGSGASSGIFQQSSGANTISTGLTLKSDVTAFNFSNSSTGLLTIGAVTGAATSGTQTITVGASSTGGITLNGIIGNGAGGGRVALNINSSGAGITTLSGASTFTGGVTMTAGTASFTSTGLGSASAANKITFAGNSTLQWGAATTTDLSSRLIINTGVTATLDTGANNVTFASIFGLENNSKGTLNKTGSGTLTLGTGVNQFAGNIVITNGRVNLNSSTNPSGQFGMWQSAYDTTGSTGAIGLNVNGQTTPWLGGLAGSVNLATAITGYGSITSLTLNPQSGSSVSYGGDISNAAMTLNKTGHGTQTLTGTNSYGGATTVWAGTLALAGASGTALNSAFTVRGGTLELDNSTNLVASRIADTLAPSVLSLGSLTLKGFNTGGIQGETVGATTFAVGGKVTVINGTAVGDRTTFAMGAVTRSTGAAIDFVGTNGTLGGAGDTPNVTTSGTFPGGSNGILPWATVNGTTWAGAATANSIVAYAGAFVDPTSAASNAADNAQLTGTGSIATAKNFNSLNVITSGAGQSLNLASGANLNLTSGGILKSGTDAYTISSGGGILGAGAGAGTELIAHVNGGALTISAPLDTDINSIAKGGTGDLILSGTRKADFNGNTSIAGGQLEFQGNGFTLSGVVTGAGGLTVNLNAGQTLNLNNNSNSYAGPTIVKGGYLSSNGYTNEGMPGGRNQTPNTNTSLIMSNLILEGGIWYSRYTTNKDIGAGPGQVQILAGTSGFVHDANSGGAASLTLDGGRELVWGSTYFNPTVFVHSTIGNLTLNLANGFDLTGSTRTILVGDATYNALAGGGSSQLGGVIRTSSGTAGLTKTGVGILLLTGASTFNGAVTVSQGTLAFQGNANVASANPLGQSSAAAANLLLANGTTLLYNGAAASTDRGFTIDGTAAGHGASLNASGSAAINFTNTASPAYGTVDQTRTLTLTGTNTNNNTLAANIADNGTGAVSVTKTGAGLWVLSGTSTYTGPTTLTAGTLSASTTSNLGAASSNLIFNGGTLQVTNTSNLPNFSTIGHTVSYTSGQTVGLDIPSSTFTADQVLNQGLGGLTKAGAGTLALNQANTYIGFTSISAGTLQLGSGTATGSLNTSSGINVASGATFAVNQTDTVTQGTDFGSFIAGAGSLANVGSGALALNAPTYHTGNTSATVGNITLSHALAIQNSALNTTGAGFVTLSGVTTPTFGGLANSGTIRDLATVISSGYTGVNGVTNLTLNPQSGSSFTYGGVIADGATGMDLTKTGAGTQTLTGNNTYTGETYVNAGTLTLSGAAGALTGTTGLTLNGGAFTLTNVAGESAVNRVNNSAGITTNGGTITWTNSSGDNTANWAETLGALSLTTGQTNIVSTNAVNAARTQVLTLGSGSLIHPASNTSAITFSGTSLGTGTVNNIVITGEAGTAANEIIGPWATYGTSAAAQTDYAAYNITGGVTNTRGIQGAAIAATAQSGWSTDYTTGTGTLNNTLANANGSAAEGRLTASRNINSLRNTTAAGGTVSAIGATDIVTMAGSAFANGDVVVFGGTVGGGLTAGIPYYVRDVSGTTFKLATTSGGGVFNITGDTGPTLNAGVTLPSGFNLGTYGILNAVATPLVIGGSGGAVTLPTTDDGNLHVTTGNGAIVIDAPINNNTGALTLVKNGSGTLTLRATTSNYSGGTIINAGTIVMPSGNATALGGSGRNLTFAGAGTLNWSDVNVTLGVLTVNTGATATLATLNGNNSITFSSTTGAGTLNFNSGWYNTYDLGNASGFTGSILMVNNAGSGAGTLNTRFTSLSDAVGSSVQFSAGGGNGNPWTQTLELYGDSGSLTFNNRQIQIGTTPAGKTHIVTMANNNATPANKWVINTDVLNLGTDLTAPKSLGLAGSNVGDNEFHGIISNGPAGGILGVSKSGNGRWIVSGTNSYTGVTTVSAGTLEVSTLANGGSASNIGASGNAAANLVLNGGTLRYTGGAVSTNRLFSVGTSSGTMDSSGTGAINFTNTGAMGFNAATGTRTLTLTGSNTDNNTIAAVIGDNAGATSVVKNGIGTWVLSGNNNSYTGTTTLNTGRLVLDYAASNTTKLANGAALTLGGGTLELSGGSHTEIVASTTLTNNTGTRITQTNSGASVLQLGTITRSNGGSTLSFSADNIATTNNTNTNGILGPGYTVGSNWAVNFTNGANGQIRALTTYTTTVPTITGVNTANYQLTGSQAQTGTTVGNTLRIVSDANDQVLSLGTFNFDLNSTNGVMGAILYAGGANNNYTISGSTGAVKAATGNNHVGVNVFTGTLTVNALLSAGTGNVTKWGAGTLIIGSNNSGLSGAHFVQEGTLGLANNGATGTTAGGITVSDGAALELSNSVAIGAEALTISGYGISNAGALRNVAGNTSSYAGVITLNTATSVGGARINSDSGGSLTLTGGVVTSLFNDVTFGGAGNTTVSTAAISGAGRLVKDGAGILSLNFANTYTGGTDLSAGTVSFANNALGTSGNITFTGNSTLQWATGNTQDVSSRVVMTNGVTSTLDTNGNNVTLAAALGGGTSGSLTKAGAGTLTLTGATTYTGPTTVSTGTLQVGNGTTGSIANSSSVTNDANLSFLTSGAVTTIGGTGTTSVAQNVAVTANRVQQDTLTLNGDSSNPAGKLTINQSSSTPAAVGDPTMVSQVTTLTIANDAAGVVAAAPVSPYTGSQQAYYATLDLKNNDLIVTNGNLALITDEIRSGSKGTGTLASPNWNGTGITSSAIASVSGTALGVIRNVMDPTAALSGGNTARYTTFDGQTLSGDEILVKYTWYGDLDLDGKLTSFDFALLDAGFAGTKQLDNSYGWFFGDLNYDGLVDSFDYSMFNTGYTGYTTYSGGGVTLPEPSTLALGLFGLGGLLAAYRRRVRKS